MRTLIIILGGFVLWAACLGIARFASASPSSTTTATTVFIVLWFLIAAANL